MTLPTSGPLSLSAIAGEFGGGAPISVSNYLRGGAYVPSNSHNTNIPTTASNVAFSDYYGGTKASLQRITFTSSTTWVVPNSISGPLIVMAVGGGAGGGAAGGGGGSGGISYNSSFSVSAGQTYSVTVGGGGGASGRAPHCYPTQLRSPPAYCYCVCEGKAGMVTYWAFPAWYGGGYGSNGGCSSFSGPSGSVIGFGGGHGGMGTNCGGSSAGSPGGSGGGGGSQAGSPGGAATQGAGGTSLYGSAGGSGSGQTGCHRQAAGGGGGAGAVGGSANVNGGGYGGAGITIFCGTYAGGGGGGGDGALGGFPFAGSGSAGGVGGGGRSGILYGCRIGGIAGYADAVSGSPNTGGGGGAGQNGEISYGFGGGTLPGNGGSGIVVIQGYW